MGWNNNFIVTATDDTQNLKYPGIGSVLKKLNKWTTLPYSIIDAFQIKELMEQKVKMLSDRINISEDMAFAILLKFSWDEEAAANGLQDEMAYLVYVDKTFKFQFPVK